MTEDAYPMISVIMTVFNGEKYIRDAILSITDQDYPNLEVCVVDDGSTDQTRSEILTFGEKINYIFQEKTGIAAGWNHGIASSKGDYLSFLDADDKWVKNKLKHQMLFLLQHPEYKIAFGHMEEFFSPELTDEQKQKFECNTKPFPGYSSGTILIERNKFLKVGLFNAHWRKGIFSDWFLRAKELNLPMYMDEMVMLKRRIHDRNHGITQRDAYIDYVRMLKASLDRRRSNPSN